MKTQIVENIPWWTPYVGDDEKELVLKVISSQYLNEGEYVDRFENEVKDILGVKFAVATTSGTSALFLSLKALEIGAGDEVIVPDITFIATANAVKLAGATPILADVDSHTLNLDPHKTRALITRKTKAIIPVHISGRSAAMPELEKLAKEFEISIVEDAAEAFSGRSNGKSLGTIGRMGCFSFSPNKTVSCGQGGIVATNEEKLFERLKELKDHGRPVRGTGGDDSHQSVGFNFKMTNLQAAIGIGQLKRLSERQKKQTAIYKNYCEALGSIKDLSLFGFSNGEVPQWTDAHCAQRDALVNYLKQNGAHCRNFWHPLHTQKPYQQSDGKFPVAIKLGYQSFWLPSSFLMTDSQQERVCSLIKNFFTLSQRKVA